MPDMAALASAIEAAVRSDSDQDGVSQVCSVCAEALPCDGTAVTVMASDAGRETVFASNAVIHEFERVQYTTGEGPSLLAFTMGRPVLVPTLSHPSAAARWPGLVSEIDQLPLNAVFCFPLRFGAINVGVAALYRRWSRAKVASGEALAFVLEALDLTTLALLELREGALAQSLLERWLAVDNGSRTQVHQATWNAHRPTGRSR